MSAGVSLETNRLPIWPLRLQELVAVLASEGHPRREQALSEAWLLLHTALVRFIRSQALRLGPLSAQDISDIASEKTLDLLQKAEGQQWSLEDRHPEEILGFFAKVARNGVVDALRHAERETKLGELEPAQPENPSALRPAVPTQPDEQLVQKEFSRALLACVRRLLPRARLIWFLRVFLGFSGHEIAAHPEVRLSRNHADMALHRARDAIRDCMTHGGFEPGPPPTGSLAMLWEVFRADLESLRTDDEP